ncbi:carotenoid oxygenase family protein [Micromonospora sp. NPDC048935]|uniref:carotenoid oxygenase family protein n=1 Tax=Micromonospora sp. NPDC048935 TaxID=3364262 RepID=UPI0037129509
MAERTEMEPPVTGTLPPELNGRFLRIGPQPVRPGRSTHALVGEGMVHGVRLRDGRALWHRNRWVRSDGAARALGELPLPGPRHGLCDITNGTVIHHAGRTLALGEAGALPVELDEELRSVARIDFDATLPHGFTSHPERDPVTDELFAVAYYHELPYAEHLVVGVDGRVRRVARIPVVGTPMMHAVALTDRHTVLFDLPVALDERLVRAGSRFPYAWQAERPSRIGLLPREGRGEDVRWFETDPCYVFHPVNAYEDSDTCVLDVIRHERVFDRDLLMPGETPPTLWRWTLDLRRGTVSGRPLHDLPQEFPRIDDRRKTRPHRYAYTISMRCDSGALSGPALLRHDLLRGTTETHDFGPGHEAGEAVFVPRGPLAAEDDGWILAYVLDRRTSRSDLVVLDTADFAGEPAATVHLGSAVPGGFHSTWLPT